MSIEQELWHSELVNERGKTITFREGVVRILRARPSTRPAVRVIPTIVKRSAVTLRNQAAAGRPVTLSCSDPGRPVISPHSSMEVSR